MDVTPVIELNGMTFECVAANGGAGDVALVHQSLELDATAIVKLFISSRAQVLVMEAPVKFGTT